MQAGSDRGVVHSIGWELYPLYATLSVLYFGLLNLWTVGDPRHVFSCDIQQRLPPSTEVPHPVGIVIGRGIHIGDRCTILHNVTIGVSEMERGVPDIGDGAVIGANAVVPSDVPAGATAAGVPAEVVSEPPG